MPTKAAFMAILAIAIATCVRGGAAACTLPRCAVCNPPAAGQTNPTTCKTCQTGYRLFMGRCTQCANNYYFTGTQCKRCPPGQYSFGGPPSTAKCFGVPIFTCSNNNDCPKFPGGGFGVCCSKQGRCTFDLTQCESCQDCLCGPGGACPSSYQCCGTSIDDVCVPNGQCFCGDRETGYYNVGCPAGTCCDTTGDVGVCTPDKSKCDCTDPELPDFAKCTGETYCCASTARCNLLGAPCPKLPPPG